MWWRIVRNNYFLLLFIFLVTVGVRWPSLHRPLGYDGYVTAHTLLTLQAWQQEGPLIAPLYTLSGEANRGINNLGGIPDEQGRYYYVSYPPFVFLLPFVVFHVLHIVASPFALQFLNLVLHFSCALGIFLLLCQVYRKNPQRKVIALAGSVFYIVLPANLWFHSAIYFADVAAQPFFIFGIFFLYQLVSEQKSRWWWYLLLFLDVFLMAYTEWIGVLFSIIGVAWLLFIEKWNTRTLFLICLLLGAVICAISITLWHYSYIAGFSVLRQELLEKYTYRSGYGALDVKVIQNVFYFYYRYYLTAIILLISLGVLWIRNRKEWRQLFTPGMASLFYLSAGPVSIHILIFLNFNSNHSFSTLKSSVFLSLLFSTLFAALFATRRWLRTVVLSGVLLLGVYQYIYQYPPAPEQNPYQALGMYIHSLALPEDVVAICSYPGGFIEPQIVWYAQRNIQSCDNLEEVRQFLIRVGKRQAVVFTVNKEKKVIRKDRILL